MPGCLAELGVNDTSLATGVGQATGIARAPGAGAESATGIFIDAHGVGIGKSDIRAIVPIGTLCVGRNGCEDCERSAPACSAALLAGAFVGCGPGPMQTAVNCDPNALAIAVDGIVNARFRYRAPKASGRSNLSSAIVYTVPRGPWPGASGAARGRPAEPVALPRVARRPGERDRPAC